jgi:hypothetical protein
MPPFSITFRPTRADFAAMMDSYWTLTSGRIWRVRLLKAFVVFAAAANVYLAWTTHDPIAVGLASFLVVAPFAVPMINKAGYARVFDRQRIGEADVVITIDDAGIDAISTIAKQTFPWPAVQNVSVTDTHSFIWIHRYLGIMLPAAAFGDRATFDRAVDFCKARVQGGPL